MVTTFQNNTVYVFTKPKKDIDHFDEHKHINRDNEMYLNLQLSYQYFYTSQIHSPHQFQNNIFKIQI